MGVYMEENIKFVKQFKRYVKKSIRGEYYNYLKNSYKYDEVYLEETAEWSEMCITKLEDDKDIVNNIGDNNFEKLFDSLLEEIEDYRLALILNKLTLSEKKIIYYIYELNWEEKDAAKYFNISVQAVNKIKHKTLKKIKKEIKIKEMNYE